MTVVLLMRQVFLIRLVGLVLLLLLLEEEEEGGERWAVRWSTSWMVVGEVGDEEESDDVVGCSSWFGSIPISVSLDLVSDICGSFSVNANAISFGEREMREKRVDYVRSWE